MLQQMFNAADLAVVGRFASAQAMAAVGSNASVINLLISIFVGLSVGATVLIASQIGAGNRKGISDAVHTVITLAFVLGVFLTAAGILDGYEGIAGTLLAEAPAKKRGIPEISDPKFIKDRYDAEILSEWGITIERNFDYLNSVKNAVFRILSGNMQKLNLPKQKQDVFKALAETELKTIAEERERLLKQAEEIWKYVKERTPDKVLLGHVADDLRQISSVKEEEFAINHGRMSFSVPVAGAEYYRNVF
jgi:hypothetical protein